MRDMNLNLDGKSVLITGASKGIGRSVALAFAAEGCAVHIAARDAVALADAKAEIEGAHGTTVTVHATDLSHSSNLRALAAACRDVDILVNNAGDLPGGPIEAIEEESFRRAWDLKVFGYIFLTQEIYAAMTARGAGVIVNDIGNSGENWDADYIVGSSGNACLMAFTRALGGVSLDHGVRVLGVNPGPVATGRMIKLMKRRALDWHGDEDRWEELYERFPAGRPATPEEVADLIVFLASPRAAYITGTIVTIDGGITSRNSII